MLANAQTCLSSLLSILYSVKFNLYRLVLFSNILTESPTYVWQDNVINICMQKFKTISGEAQNIINVNLSYNIMLCFGLINCIWQRIFFSDSFWPGIEFTSNRKFKTWTLKNYLLMPNLKFKSWMGSKREALIISALMETSVSAMN